MSLTVSGKLLHDALGRVMATVERRNSNPVLSHVHLAAGGGELAIEGTDLDVKIIARVDADGELPPTLIEGERLATVVAQVKDRGDIELRIKDTGQAELVAGRSRFTLATLPPDSWGRLIEVGEANHFKVDGKPFARLMTALSPAISDEETRPYLNGILIEGTDLGGQKQAGVLTTAATNGHICYARSLPIDGDLGARRATIPTKTCALIAKLFGESTELEVAIGDTKIEVAVDRTVLTSKLVEGHFPDWRRVVPAHVPQLSYDTKALTLAINTAAAGVRDGKGKKIVKLIFGESGTEIEARELANPAFTGGDACGHSGDGKPPIENIAFAVGYLVDMLAGLDAETVEIALTSATGPAILTGAALADRRIAVMPMRAW